MMMKVKDASPDKEQRRRSLGTLAYNVIYEEYSEASPKVQAAQSPEK